MRLMHDDVRPVHGEPAIKRRVLARSAQLRRHRRVRRAVAPIAAGLVVAALLVEGVPTGLRTTGPPVPPAQDGAGHPVGPVPGSTVESGMRAGGGPVGMPAVPLPVDGSAVAGPDDRGAPDAPALPRMALVRHDALWVVLTDGTVTAHLVEGNATQPAWSPDGRSIAYTQRFNPASGGDRIMVFDLASHESRVVTMPENYEASDPAWSPDGRSLAATGVTGPWSTQPSLEPVVIVVDLDAHDVRSLGPGRRPAWSSDGRILYERQGRLWVTAADGSTSSPVPQSNGLVGPAWSPDAGWISAVDADGGLVVLRPDGSDRRVVARGARGRPAWLPDGSRLAYPAASGIRSVRPDGDDERDFTDVPDDHDVAVTGSATNRQ